MKNCFPRSPGRLSGSILMAILAISFATQAYAAPSEENISGSRPVRTPRVRSTSDHVQNRWSADPGSDPGVEGSNRERPEDEGVQVPGAVSSEGSAPTPRAVFPYTVRAGDTPAGIAVQFGVPLADLLRLNHIHQDGELMIGDTLRI